MGPKIKGPKAGQDNAAGAFPEGNVKATKKVEMRPACINATKNLMEDMIRIRSEIYPRIIDAIRESVKAEHAVVMTGVDRIQIEQAAKAAGIGLVIVDARNRSWEECEHKDEIECWALGSGHSVGGATIGNQVGIAIITDGSNASDIAGRLSGRCDRIDANKWLNTSQHVKKGLCNTGE